MKRISRTINRKTNPPQYLVLLDSHSIATIDRYGPGHFEYQGLAYPTFTKALSAVLQASSLSVGDFSLESETAYAAEAIRCIETHSPGVPFSKEVVKRDYRDSPLEDSRIAEYAAVYSDMFDCSSGSSYAASVVRKKVPFVTIDEVQSIVHEAYIRFVRNRLLERLDTTKGSLETLVFAVTRSSYVQFLASRTKEVSENRGNLRLSQPRLHSDDDEPLDIVGDSPTPEENLSAMNLYDAIQARLGVEFPTKKAVRMQKMLALLYEGYSEREVAAELGVSRSTISNYQRDMQTMVSSMDS